MERLEPFVVLCGIGYHVGESEGLVTFVNRDILGMPYRINFRRDEHDQSSALWYVEIEGRTGVPVDHIVAAYRLVATAYGGAHEFTPPHPED